MKPPLRNRRQRVIPGVTEETVSNGERWTVMEKQQLLQGLRSYGPTKLERIQKEYLPLRNMIDIKFYIKNLKIRYKLSKRKESMVREQAPIESWLTEAEGLTHLEHDYSITLQQVFSVFSRLEPHDMLPHGHAPDWSEVYLYISELMKGRYPPKPSPSNAMILLDLIDSLADDLCSQDITPQRRLMQLKADLLKQVANAKDKNNAYAALQPALERDPLVQLRAQSSAQQSPNIAQQSPNIAQQSPNISQQAPNISQQAPNISQQSPNISQQSPNISQQQGNPSTPRLPQNAPAANETVTSQDSQQSPSTPASAGQSTNRHQGANTSSNTSANRSPGKKVRIKRSPLYSLNPFCIPIKYLKMSAGMT